MRRDECVNEKITRTCHSTGCQIVLNLSERTKLEISGDLGSPDYEYVDIFDKDERRTRCAGNRYNARDCEGWAPCPGMYGPGRVVLRASYEVNICSPVLQVRYDKCGGGTEYPTSAPT